MLSEVHCFLVRPVRSAYAAQRLRKLGGNACTSLCLDFGQTPLPFVIEKIGMNFVDLA